MTNMYRRHNWVEEAASVSLYKVSEAKAILIVNAYIAIWKQMTNRPRFVLNGNLSLSITIDSISKTPFLRLERRILHKQQAFPNCGS